MLIGGISKGSGSLQFKGKSREKTAAKRLSRVRLKVAKGIQGGHGNRSLGRSWSGREDRLPVARQVRRRRVGDPRGRARKPPLVRLMAPEEFEKAERYPCGDIIGAGCRGFPCRTLRKSPRRADTF